MTDDATTVGASSPDEAPAFDAAGLACDLLRGTRTGALATLDPATGAPLATLVTVATDMDGTPLLLLSRLSAHTGNLDRDGRASLLLVRTGRGDPLAHPRLSLVGTVGRVQDSVVARCRRRFLARHPKAALYAGFPDFGFFRMQPESGHLNGGFARAATLPARDFLCDLAGADALVEAEEGAVAHMNADHRDALQLYATALCGALDGAWVATGLDPYGMDLAAGERTARLPFPERVTGPGDLRRVLVELAAAARARPLDS